MDTLLFLLHDPEIWSPLVEMDRCPSSSRCIPSGWGHQRFHLQLRCAERSGHNSEVYRIHQLLQGFEPVNNKLSELPREMRRLRGAVFGDNPMLGLLWLQRFLPHLPPLLSTDQKYSLGEYAKFADDIMSRCSSGVSSLNNF